MMVTSEPITRREEYVVTLAVIVKAGQVRTEVDWNTPGGRGA
jgi:hypothetical protein